jgi:hypothetical protein
VALELAQSLLRSDAVTREGLARALFASVTEGVPLVRALLVTGALDERLLDAELARWDGPTVRDLSFDAELVAKLPAGLCRRLLALPLCRDRESGAVHVAVADGRDPHGPLEIAAHLGLRTEPFRARLGPLLAAIDRLDGAARSGPVPLAAPMWVRPDLARMAKMRTPAWGTPIPSPPSPSVAPHVVRVTDSERPIPLLRRSKAPRAEPQRDAEIPPASRRPARSSFVTGPLPLPPAEPVLAALRAAHDRDAVIALVLTGVHAVARRVAILVVKRDLFLGWACTPEFCDVRTLRAVQIPTTSPSILATAAAAGTYLGPIFETEAHVPLLQAMGRASRDVAITPVRVSGRPALILVADELADAALSTQRIDEIAEEAGKALGRVVRRR